MAKRTRVLGNVLVLLGMFSACSVLIALMLLMRKSDPLLPPESPETIAKRSAPENAYFPLVDALKLLPVVSGASVAPRLAQNLQPEIGSMGWAAGVPRPDDDPELAKYLKGCEPAFVKAREALQRPYFLIPINWSRPVAFDWRDDPRAKLAPVKTLCGALSARAMLASRSGDEKGALDFALEGARVSVRVNREEMDASFLETFPRAIHEIAPRASEATLERALSEIAQIRAGIGSNQEAVLFHLREMDYWTGRFWRITSWNDVERGFNNLTSLFDYRGARRWIRANREFILALADKPFPEARRWARNVVSGNDRAGQGTNAVRRRYSVAGEGRGVSGSIANSVYHISAQRALISVFLDGAALMVALERCKRAEGGYPERLEGLSPKWIDAMPNDAFSGGAFVYARDGEDYRLYSPGGNLRDDGAGGSQGTKDGSSDDDVVIYRPYVKPN